MVNPRPEVLIVEDDDYWIEHYRRILQHFPIDIHKANTVTEAAGLIGKHYFAAVVADLELPGLKEASLGGFEVIEAARKRSPYTEMVVITGHSEHELLDRVARASVGCITKPVHHRELILAVTSMLNVWRARFTSLAKMLNTFSELLPILQTRGHNKPPFRITDEYDLQDILHFLFKPSFPDVVVEEYTLKRAGKTKRLDLVVKGLETVVETKIVRTKEHAKKVSDELDIDIRGYVSHPYCRRLICFVYDPKHYIKDPRTLESDLSGEQSQSGRVIEVVVMVRPA